MKSVKDLLVDYTANKIRRREVAIQDIMELLDREFPEFLKQITSAYYQAGYDDAVKSSKPSDDERNEGKKLNKRVKKKRSLDESELY
jgi:pilus assembly protein TadC